MNRALAATKIAAKPIQILPLLFWVFSFALAAQAKDYAVFDVVGDSISYGINRDYPLGAYGWVHMMSGQGGGAYPTPKTLTINTLWPGITKYNSAISGSRASDWAATPTTPLTTVLNHHPDLVVVFIGGNDFLAYCADGTVTAAELAQYRHNLETILDRLRANTPRPDIIVVDYYDLADGYSANLPGLFAAYRALSQAAVNGNQIIHEVAQEKGVQQLTIYNDFLHHGYGGTLGDSNHLSPDYFPMPMTTNFDIHPVTAGHSAIYEAMYAKLRQMKETTLRASGWINY